MEVRLPQDLITWLDENRDTRSRQSQMIAILMEIKKSPENYNTEEILHAIKTKGKRS